jgi:hypothetical protein
MKGRFMNIEINTETLAQLTEQLVIDVSEKLRFNKPSNTTVTTPRRRVVFARIASSQQSEYRSKGKLSNEQYDSFILTHPFSQIFRVHSDDCQTSIPVQLWCGGYYFDSDYFTEGCLYSIDSITYECTTKTRLFIILEEATT